MSARVPISSRESYKNESHWTISGTIRPIGYWPAPPFSAVEQYGILARGGFLFRGGGETRRHSTVQYSFNTLVHRTKVYGSGLKVLRYLVIRVIIRGYISIRMIFNLQPSTFNPTRKTNKTASY
jgi:hypothetical protein